VKEREAAIVRIAVAVTWAVAYAALLMVVCVVTLGDDARWWRLLIIAVGCAISGVALWRILVSAAWKGSGE